MNNVIVGLFLSMFILSGYNCSLVYSQTRVEQKDLNKKSLLKHIPNKTEKFKNPPTLLNHNGERVAVDSLLGKPLVMTFIYTRCPSPTKCPLIMRRMVRLQKELADYRDEVDFAIVTIDPGYDTPRVLKEYGEVSDADFHNFTLLSGAQEDVDRLTKRFKIYVEEEEPGILSHSLETFLMDSKGVIRRVFLGAFWEVEVAAEETIKLIEEEQKLEVEESDA